MLNESEVSRMLQSPELTDVPKLLEEIVRLKKFILDYGMGIEAQLGEIDLSRQALVDENQRLIDVKNSALLERDACLGLMLKLANKNGLKVGRAQGNRVALDLPVGQVVWEYADSEAHLFEELPEYAGDVEIQPLLETYSRVMNPF